MGFSWYGFFGLVKHASPKRVKQIPKLRIGNLSARAKYRTDRFSIISELAQSPHTLPRCLCRVFTHAELSEGPVDPCMLRAARLEGCIDPVYYPV